MPILNNDQFRNVDGSIVGTGLHVPDTKVDRTIQTLQSALAMRVDEQDVKEMLKDPRRRPARKRFPPKKWIRNQGRRGSCNGFACAKALSRARKAIGQPEVHLSGEFVYAGINGGYDRGSMLDAGMEFLQKKGSCPESMVRHEEYLWRNISDEAKREAQNYLAFDCLAVESALDLAIGQAFGFPAVVAVHFSNAMQRLDSEGVAGGGRGPGNHSVGVDDVRWCERHARWEFDYFNSHGLSYGEDGKAWLYWDLHFAETIKYHEFFVIRSASDNLKDDFGFTSPLRMA